MSTKPNARALTSVNHFRSTAISRRLRSRDGVRARAKGAPRSGEAKLYRYFNIGVRSVILNGAPFAYKTTNISVLDLFARDGGLQDISAADDPDGLIIDFDRVDDRADSHDRTQGSRIPS